MSELPPGDLPGALVDAGEKSSRNQRWAAYGVHLFTATGVVFAFLAAAEVCTSAPNVRLVFFYLAIQVIIDAVDGPMARKYHVKRLAPSIDGRKIDDIVDYLTYTFIPLLLVWKMEWLPEPVGLWIAPAMVASLFGFSNLGAKDEDGGFFLGFPSYWNIVAFYVALWFPMFGPWPGAVLLVMLTVLTVLPVRFIYPNLAPHPWRLASIAGAAVWALLFIWMLLLYPRVPGWLMWFSLLYPAAYLGLSMYLDLQARRNLARRFEHSQT